MAAEAQHRIGLGGGAPLLAPRLQAQRGSPRRVAQQRDARLRVQRQTQQFRAARLLEGDWDRDQWLASALTGTRLYMTLEYCHDGKFSIKTDVYSFWIVVLDITYGRKTREVEMQLVEWVWELYGRGKIPEAADWRLTGVFDSCEMERLMVVGLWWRTRTTNSGQQSKR